MDQNGIHNSIKGDRVAIVLAAGKGSRMHSDVAKQFLPLCGKPVLCYSLDVFEQSDYIDRIILVAGREGMETCSEIVKEYGYKKVSSVVTGGKERYHSVRNGLNAALYEEDSAVENPPALVLIHDGARPFVSEEIIEENIKALEECSACVTGVPSKDTVKIADSEGFVASTPERALVWNVQTPQSFHFSLVHKAYEQLIEKEAEILEKGIRITDDAMVVEYFTNERVKLVEGSYENIKITTPEDLIIAENIIKRHK